MKYLIYIIIAVVGIWLGKSMASKRKSGNKQATADKKDRFEKKKENKEKILTLFKHRDTIVNNDVEKLIGVSDSMATKYLQELEDDGKIEQIGSTGHAVYYRKL